MGQEESSHLTGRPHVCWEEFSREKEGQGLYAELDRDDQEAGGEEAGHLQGEHVLHHLGRAGDEIGEGGEEVEADDGEDEGGEVHCPPGEGHEYPGESEGGAQPAEPYHDGGDVGHGGGVVADLRLSLHQAGVAVAAAVTEHGVEDGDAVGSDNADTAELLDYTDEDNDEERFVDFWVVPDVPHVVTLSLFISPEWSRLS